MCIHKGNLFFFFNQPTNQPSSYHGANNTGRYNNNHMTADEVSITLCISETVRRIKSMDMVNAEGHLLCKNCVKKDGEL